MSRKLFTLKTLDLPQRPKSGFTLLFDAHTTGLALRVPAVGTPIFQVIARTPEGKEKRVTIAVWIPHGAISCTG